MREEDFDNGGIRIHFRSWTPAEPARAVLVIGHGVNSHGGQYIWTAEQFVALGFAVYAVDLRGRGKSEGERFYVEDVAEYVSDLSGVIGIAKQRHPGAKLTLDALCSRYGIDRSHRVLHGALLDAQLLAQVYVELSGGRQIGLTLVSEMVVEETIVASASSRPMRAPRHFAPSDEELSAHAAFMTKIKNPIWGGAVASG